MITLHCSDTIYSLKKTAVEHIPFFVSAFVGNEYSVPFPMYRIQHAIFENNDFEVMDFFNMKGGTQMITIECADLTLKIKHPSIKHIPFFENPGHYSIPFMSLKIQEALNGYGDSAINEFLGVSNPYKRISCYDGILHIKINEYNVDSLPICDLYMRLHKYVNEQSSNKPNTFYIDSLNNECYNGSMLQLLIKLDPYTIKNHFK
jgi:hypothetical protein